MTPLEMIAEWRKGCSVSCFDYGEKHSPEYCHECTRALIDSLESKLKREVQIIEDGTPFVRIRYFLVSGLLVGIPIGNLLGNLSAFIWLPVAAWGLYSIWKERQ